jgi:two-component system, LytTR family, sensor kinase
MTSAFALRPTLTFWRLQLAGWAFYAVMIYVTWMTVTAETNLLRLVKIKGFRTLVGFVLSCLMRWIYKRWSPRGDLRSMATLSLICSSLFGLLWTRIEFLFLAFLSPALVADITPGRALKVTLDYAVTLLAWSALYFGIKTWQAWDVERERALRAAASAERAQMEMLRYQLNPHFLFNALNSIRASIDEDAKRAKRMITEFSEFLRFSLQSSNAGNIPLREEIEAIRNYLAIEKIRFEDRLDIEFDVQPAAADFQLPGFLIHPLIENAVKHGMNGSAAPLKVRLAAHATSESVVIEVSNTGRWAGIEAVNGGGVGLRNVRERLEQQYPGRHRFKIGEKDGWICARVEIDRAIEANG